MKEGKTPQQADALVAAVRTDFRTADLSKLEMAILEYSEKLTRQPSAIQQSDVQSLRDNGLDDRAIHDLCSIVAYFAFANRVANGLGIELEASDGNG